MLPSGERIADDKSDITHVVIKGASEFNGDLDSRKSMRSRDGGMPSGVFLVRWRGLQNVVRLRSMG